MNSVKYIPNILTFFRISLVPFFIISFINIDFHIKVFSFILFLIGSLTDFFDGYIARRYNLITNLGKIIDPIADKILILSALIMLYLFYPENVKIWMLLSIFLRDVIVTLFRLNMRKKNIILQANVITKRKTLIQIIIIHFFLLFHIYFKEISMSENFPIFNQIFFYLMVFCTLITVFSGLHYIIINYDNE